MDKPVAVDHSPGPVSQSERIVAIDVLRGFAVLGILVMNIQSFAMISAAYFNPTAYGDLSGGNYLVWVAGRLLADQKFMSIFSMLFGAGIVLMAERQVRAGGRPALMHYRRMGILIVFGLLHAYLLWDGDILFTYGICALVVYLLRKLPPIWLLTIGIGVLSVAMLINTGITFLINLAPPEDLVDLQQGWQPDSDEVVRELAAYRGGWWTQMSQRAPFALLMQTLILGIWSFWRAGGLMLVGMAFYKWGVFCARLRPSIYWALLLGGMILGLLLTFLGIHHDEQSNWALAVKFTGKPYQYWGSALVSFGWIGLVMLLCQGGWLRGLTRRLAAVGQMALTNYLMQTVVCTTLFYGHGFGLFGSVNRMGQIGIVVAIWTVQLLASPWWLAHFYYGPMEWLWRTLTYGKLQPFRRQSTPGFTDAYSAAQAET